MTTPVSPAYLKRITRNIHIFVCSGATEVGKFQDDKLCCMNGRRCCPFRNICHCSNKTLGCTFEGNGCCKSRATECLCKCTLSAEEMFESYVYRYSIKNVDGEDSEGAELISGIHLKLQEQCLCEHDIVENCFIQRKPGAGDDTWPEWLIIGNECVKRLCEQGTAKTCVTCFRRNRSRNSDKCKDCRTTLGVIPSGQCFAPLIPLSVADFLELKPYLAALHVVVSSVLKGNQPHFSYWYWSICDDTGTVNVTWARHQPGVIPFELEIGQPYKLIVGELVVAKRKKPAIEGGASNAVIDLASDDDVASDDGEIVERERQLVIWHAKKVQDQTGQTGDIIDCVREPAEERVASEELCVACLGSGTSYWSDDVYGPCLECRWGSDE